MLQTSICQLNSRPHDVRMRNLELTAAHLSSQGCKLHVHHGSPRHLQARQDPLNVLNVLQVAMQLAHIAGLPLMVTGQDLMRKASTS